MSKKAYLTFLDRAAQDKAMQHELAGIATGDPAVIRAEALARFATERGFAVTADDVRGHNSELRDGELEQVAGGIGSATGGAGSGRLGVVKDWIDFAPLATLLGLRRR